MENTLSLTRICPACGIELKYKSIKICKQAEREKSTCLKCRPTKTKLSQQQRSERKLSTIEYQKRYRKDNFDILKRNKQLYVENVKSEVFSKYGNKCNCCGESELKFLTIDHIDGRWKNGLKDKKTGKKLYAYVKKLNFPTEFQLLCFNCNCAKGIFGECPHKSLTKNKMHPIIPICE